MSGLFSTFNIAKNGMTVQQKSIGVTSHNIANANTVGYSRQVARIETSRPYGGVTMGSSTQPGQIGTGAQIRAIERVRDTFLDYQVRNETSVLGKYEVRGNFLYEIESIFNEPSDTGISNLMGKFFDAFQELSKQPNSSNSRTVAAQQTLALTDALNTTYTQLEKLKANGQDMLKSTVTEVNSLLNQLDTVNQEIINVTVSKNTPNDLMDKRDLLLDELSAKFGIVVEKDSFNGINLKPAEGGDMKANLLVNSSQNGDIARFSYVTNVEEDTSIVADPNNPTKKTYIVTYYKNGDMTSESNKQTMKVSGLNKEEADGILSNGILWADKAGQATKSDGSPISDGDAIDYEELMMFTPTSGSVNGLVSVQKDIQTYMNQLDKLAKAIAFTVNAVHSGKTDGTKDTMPFFVNKDTITYNPDGSVTNNGEEKISAKNITVSKEILNDVMKINVGKDGNSGEGDGSRALAIAQLRNSLIRIQDINEKVITREDLFDKDKGGSALSEDGLGIINSKSGMSLSSYFKDTIDRLGVQAQEAGRMVKNQGDLLYSIEETRASVSGVSLDEEMANLIQFQHAYNANAKIISTIDELLEVVINGLKR